MSAVFDWGRNQDEDSWNSNKLDQLKDALRKAKEIDDLTGQPDCEDPAKGEFLARIERRLDAKAAVALIDEIAELAGEPVGGDGTSRRNARDRLKSQLADLAIKNRGALKQLADS